MVDVFVDRRLDGHVVGPEVAEREVLEMPGLARRCLDLHRVQHQESWLATDGRRWVCRFTAPDAESVRLALRRAGVAYDSVWSCRRITSPPSQLKDQPSAKPS